MRTKTKQVGRQRKGSPPKSQSQSASGDGAADWKEKAREQVRSIFSFRRGLVRELIGAVDSCQEILASDVFDGDDLLTPVLDAHQLLNQLDVLFARASRRDDEVAAARGGDTGTEPQKAPSRPAGERQVPIRLETESGVEFAAFDLPESTVAQLEAMATARGVTVPEIIKHCVDLKVADLEKGKAVESGTEEWNGTARVGGIAGP